MSELEKLLQILPNGTNLPLDAHSDPAISLPDRNLAFVRPPIVKEGGFSEQLPAIVVISAPGAVGKSELARFIAVEKNCHLWDLSKLSLGTNTFRGTLAKSFDLYRVSELVDNLREGNVLFVLDAFDEAEIISGWTRVEEFLSELFSFVYEARKPCLVLFARSNTAQYINLYLETVAEDYKVPPCHATYSIGYFPEPQAVDFIEQQLKSLGKYSQQKHSSTFKEAVRQMFSLFYRAVRADKEKTPWKLARVHSFLGYAPVLQAIARYLDGAGNFIQVTNKFKEQDTFGDGVELVSSLMDELLQREQKKLIDQLRNIGIAEAVGWLDWDTLYTPDEQLQRLFLYIHNRQKASIVNNEMVKVPTWLVEEYSKAVDRFLHNHPFLLDNKFAGPAFQDYAYARLLARQLLYEEVKSAWHNVTSSYDSYVSSPLFSLLYYYLNNGYASGDLVGYLYESAIARRSFKSQPQVLVIPKEDVDGAYWLKILDNEAQEELKSDISFVVSTDEYHPITFPRQLEHAYIEVNGSLVLGKSDVSLDLSDVEIICSKLILKSNRIVIRNYEKDETVSITASEYFQESMVVNVDCNAESSVSISWPNGKQHPWIDYYYASISFDSPDMGKAVLALRRLLSFFRKDRKNEFARHRQLVDNVVVGENKMRQQVRDYLLELNVLTHREPLYFLDMRTLEAVGINFAALRKGELHPESRKFVADFLKWAEKR